MVGDSLLVDASAPGLNGSFGQDAGHRQRRAPTMFRRWRKAAGFDGTSAYRAGIL